MHCSVTVAPVSTRISDGPQVVLHDLPETNACRNQAWKNQYITNSNCEKVGSGTARLSDSSGNC